MNRNELKQEFRDGERPEGKDFAELIDSFMHKFLDDRPLDRRSTDGLAIDADGNVALPRGLRLGDSAGAAAGGLRFNNNQVQFHDGTAWTNLATGGGGAFQPVGAGTEVSYNGNVGVGAFAAAPTYRLEVPLGFNTGPTERVRFGNVVCCNGSATFNGFALFAHQDHASNANYALRQGPSGEVHINAASGQAVSIRQNGIAVRLGISPTGHVIVGGDADLAGAGTAIFQVAGDALINNALRVNGAAAKPGGGMWADTSDSRVKEDVRDLEAGLTQLRQVRPVRFRYNGRAGTIAGQPSVGVIAQEIERIFPEMIRRVPGGFEDDPSQEDLRIYDGSALTYVLINAVKELAIKVEQLEQALAELHGAAAGDGNPG